MNSSPPNRKPKTKSYAQAAATVQVSLMHQQIVEPHHDDDSTLRSLQTRIFRTSRTPGAHLFDISAFKGKYTDQQCMIALKQQHPNVHACVPLSDGPCRYLEVYITKQNDQNDIANTGIVFRDFKLQVFPCSAIEDTAKIIKLKLSHVPLFTKDEVLDGLKQSLEIFDKVLDVGITTEAETGFFMGAGYAVLNVYQPADTPDSLKFQELSHQLNWCESDAEFFHATWNNMPTWCRYCHKDGHTKFECPLSKARILCYSCHQQGHRSFECPRRNVPMNSYKKQDRKSYLKKKNTPTKTTNESDNEDADSNYTDDNINDSDGISFTEEKEELDNEPDQLTQEADEILMIKQAIQQYNNEELERAILETIENEEFTSVDYSSNPLAPKWKVNKPTSRAVALFEFLNEQMPDRLTQSTHVVTRRPANAQLGDFMINQSLLGDINNSNSQ
jgi:hypothetical protein